jgi:hypothetical protein
MAETTTESSQELPDNGPWSLGWQAITKAAGNVINEVVQPVKESIDQLVNGKMPCELGSSELASVTANKPPPDLPPSQAPAAAPSAPMTTAGLFSKLVNTESGFKHLDENGNLLTSSKGAQGITQVLPKTGGDPGYGVTPIQNNSPDEYLRFGKDYLNAMMKNFHGNAEQAVAAYNAGPGRIQKAVDRAQRTGGDWKLYIPDETRKYVTKILGNGLALVTGSSNANASADFSDYLNKTNTTSTGPTKGYNGKPDGGKFVTQDNAVGKQVVNIIQKDFPDHVDAINTKITGDQPSEGADASFGGLGGDKIALGNIKGDNTVWFDKNGKPSKNNQPPPVEKVNEALATTLHEIQHARMQNIGTFNAGLGKDWKQMLSDAAQHDFPSVQQGIAVNNGDSLNEFLATATTIKEMQRRGYTPTGRYAEPAAALATMEHKYPWLKQYVINYIYPEAENSASNRDQVAKNRTVK